MTPRTLAALQAAGRLALGAGIAAAPSLVAGGWVGAVADRAVVAQTLVTIWSRTLYGTAP